GVCINRVQDDDIAFLSLEAMHRAAFYSSPAAGLLLEKRSDRSCLIGIRRDDGHRFYARLRCANGEVHADVGRLDIDAGLPGGPLLARSAAGGIQDDDRIAAVGLE